MADARLFEVPEIHAVSVKPETTNCWYGQCYIGECWYGDCYLGDCYLGDCWAGYTGC